MILIGQYDSSYVRRVGIALRLYDIPFEHRPWSTFGEADRIREYNPLTRVPTLVLDDGEVLFDMASMIDHLDGLVAPERRLHPVEEPVRRRSLAVAALATGLADKTVGLFYELRFHDRPSEAFVARCRRQILDTLAVLEADRAARPGDFWFGRRIGHADIAVTAVLRHAAASHPDLIDLPSFPALAAHGARFEAMPVFEDISQPFIPPA